MTKPSIMAAAQNYLAKREHAAVELAAKLAQKGFNEKEVSQALEFCQNKGWQSDQRYAEMLCRTRIRQGYGPIKIQQELKAKQIDQAYINAVIQQEDWLQHVYRAYQKKYKNKPRTAVEINKCKKFLLYRGFSMDLITKISKAVAY